MGQLCCPATCALFVPSLRVARVPWEAILRGAKVALASTYFATRVGIGRAPSAGTIAQKDGCKSNKNSSCRCRTFTWCLPCRVNSGGSCAHQKTLLDVLFRAAFDSLAALCKDSRYLDGQIGALAVLHTWTRTLEWHPHVHMLVRAARSRLMVRLGCAHLDERRRSWCR